MTDDVFRGKWTGRWRKERKGSVKTLPTLEEGQDNTTQTPENIRRKYDSPKSTLSLSSCPSYLNRANQVYFTVPPRALQSQSHPPPSFLPRETFTPIPTFPSRKHIHLHLPLSAKTFHLSHHLQEDPSALSLIKPLFWWFTTSKHSLQSPLPGPLSPPRGSRTPTPLPPRRAVIPAPLLPLLPLSLRSRYSAASSSRWMLIIWTCSMAPRPAAGGLRSPGPPSAPTLPAPPLETGAAAGGRSEGSPFLPSPRASSHR